MINKIYYLTLIHFLFLITHFVMYYLFEFVNLLLQQTLPTSLLEHHQILYLHFQEQRR